MIPSIATIVESLVPVYGECERTRITRGVGQVAACWRDDDGTSDELAAFCTARFVAEGPQLSRLLSRIEGALEQITGHLYEMRRTLRRHSDLAGDEFPGIDDMLAMFDPAPDLSEQMYRQKLGFVALLNFPRETLDVMLAEGSSWDDARWASVRIAQQFTARLPKELADESRRVSHSAQQWVAAFHIPVGTLVDSTGTRWFENDRALLTHWIVREEIKGQYNDRNGVTRQRALAGVLGRAIDGGVPLSVMNRSNTSDWNAQSNTIAGVPVRSDTMGLARYERLLDQFALARKYDAYYPEYPTAIARKFELAREMTEQSVEQLLIDLLDHPVRTALADYLRSRLGRDLEPFDIYFDDIAESRPASELNAAVRALFPDEKAFERALPQTLRGLGFCAADADFLGSRIRVEIARGSGHAMRPYLVEYGAWLRTGRLKDEFGWDGFDTAMHELGHNLEQLCSTFFAPRPSLRGVPNTACTEAFAFLYQSLGKRVLGIEPPGGSARAFAIDSVQTMLAAAQIAGPSLLELHVWRWMYANPSATAAALREQVLAIADRLWVRYYERDFGKDSNRLLAAYQHMVAHPLYLADYTLGHVMSHQIRSFMRDKDIASETRRITSLGRLTPELWMQRAVGMRISATPLADDTREALTLLESSAPRAVATR